MPSLLKRAIDRFYEFPSLLLALAALSWAGNTVAGRLSIGEVTPFTLVFLRWLGVIAILWPLYGGTIRTHWAEIRPRLLQITLMAGLGFTGFNTLFYIAAHDTTAVNLGILQGSMPVFVLAMALVAHRTPVTFVQFLGVLITSVGVVMVATKGDPQAALSIGFNRGDLAMLAACVLYSFYAVALKNRPAMPGPAFFTLLAIIATLTSIPLVIYEVWAGVWTPPTTQGLIITAWVAIFPSCLAQLWFLRGVDLIGPGRAGVFINLVPVFAAILAVGLINEPFAWYHGVALALVLGGIWLAQQTPKPAADIAANAYRGAAQAVATTQPTAAADLDPKAAGRTGLHPYLVVRNGARAIEFYTSAFGAVESFRLAEPSGKIGHAELWIGGSQFMLVDEYPDFGALGPESLGGSSVKLQLYVEHVDSFVARAVAAGARLARPPCTEFYGDRVAILADPFGYSWVVASQVEEVSPAEMQRRWSAILHSGSR